MNLEIKEFNMRVEVSYQDDFAQYAYDDANKDVKYVFGECPLKIKSAINEAKKYGHGILFIVNGSKIIREILF